jgi:hypothetical protein
VSSAAQAFSASGSRFVSNTVMSPGGTRFTRGGAVSLAGGNATVRGCAFLNNELKSASSDDSEAQGKGGAFAHDAPPPTSSDTLNLYATSCPIPLPSGPGACQSPECRPTSSEQVCVPAAGA